MAQEQLPANQANDLQLTFPGHPGIVSAQHFYFLQLYSFGHLFAAGRFDKSLNNNQQMILISLDRCHISFDTRQAFSFLALPVPQVIGQVPGQSFLAFYHRTYSRKSMPCPGIVYVLQVCMEVRLSCGSKRGDNHEALFPVRLPTSNRNLSMIPVLFLSI